MLTFFHVLAIDAFTLVSRSPHIKIARERYRLRCEERKKRNVSTTGPKIFLGMQTISRLSYQDLAIAEERNKLSKL